MGGLGIAGCGDAVDPPQSAAPRLEYATNTPPELADADAANFATANHLQPAAETNVDGHVRPADFSWRDSGPALPPSKAMPLTPAEAWQAEANLAAQNPGKPAESLYPTEPAESLELSNRPPSFAPSQQTPWSLTGPTEAPVLPQHREPPPPEAYGLSSEDLTQHDPMSHPAAARSPALFGAPIDSPPQYPSTNSPPELPWGNNISNEPQQQHPVAASTDRPWKVDSWETGQRAAYAPHAAAPAVLPVAVARRAEELTQNAFELAGRGATYSAREELIRALEIVAESLDAAEHTAEHRRALAAAFRAMDEATDFAPRGSTLLHEIDIKTVASGHLTPILQQQGAAIESISAVECSRAYYTFAQQKLAFACGSQQPASLALYGLGKLNAVLARAGEDVLGDPSTRSVVFHQAALAVDGGNWRAANELAVQLAQSSRFEEARGWLQHATQLSDSPELWSNLAAVHGYLGEERLAREASAQSERLAQRTGVSTAPVDLQWLPPQAFRGAPR